MKKLLLMVTTMGLLSTFSSYSFSVKKNDTLRARKNSARYCVALTLSACIGAVTGELVRCIEKELNIEKSPIALFLYLLSWTLESGIRNEIVSILQKDLDTYSTAGHRGYLMFRAAQIASWAMYLRDHIQQDGLIMFKRA